MAENKPIEERMNNVELALGEFETKNALPPCAPPGTEEELSDYLQMSKERLKSLDSTDCAEIAFRLAQYSTYVQRLRNIELARYTWAESMLFDIASPHMQSYDKYMKHEAKLAMMARESTSVAKIRDILRYTKQRMDRLEDLADRIYNMARVMENLRREKVTSYRVNGADHE
jgi:hypothetical protein